MKRPEQFRCTQLLRLCHRRGRGRKRAVSVRIVGAVLPGEINACENASLCRCR